MTPLQRVFGVAGKVEVYLLQELLCLICCFKLTLSRYSLHLISNLVTWDVIFGEADIETSCSYQILSKPTTIPQSTPTSQRPLELLPEAVEGCGRCAVASRAGNSSSSSSSKACFSRILLVICQHQYSSRRVSSLSTDTPAAGIVQGGRCRLLELPVELQLSIYELAVPNNELFLLNYPGNSFYRRRFAVLCEDQKAWKSGAKCPPKQPAITQTCRFIRNETLPMFYERNIFRACYCQMDEMLTPVVRWLTKIGPRNREMLKHLYFYDRNERQDIRFPRVLQKLKDSEVCTMMGGTMESIYTADFCAHWVTCGPNARKPGGVALAWQLGARVLGMEGEV